MQIDWSKIEPYHKNIALAIAKLVLATTSILIVGMGSKHLRRWAIILGMVTKSYKFLVIDVLVVIAAAACSKGEADG